MLAEGAMLPPYAFESCLAHTRAGPAAPIMPPPQADSSGVQSVTLGVDATHIGHRAHENCKQLIKVDMFNASLDILNMHTFSHCVKLREISLPPTLQEIQAEAFKGCLGSRQH